MGNYSDSTANMASGSVDKEMRQMQKRAAAIKTLHKRRQLTPELLAEANLQFRGIYRRILLEALLDETQAEVVTKLRKRGMVKEANRILTNNYIRLYQSVQAKKNRQPHKAAA